MDQFSAVPKVPAWLTQLHTSLTLRSMALRQLKAVQAKFHATVDRMQVALSA